MKIQTASTIPALVPAIKGNMHEMPFMVVARRHAKDDDLMLYGGTVSCAQTFKQVLSDHPMAVLVQEVEYLNPAQAEAKAKEMLDASRGGLRDLGIVPPDA